MIKSTKDLHQTGKINAIIYGAPGVGKTSLAKTVERPLVISAEGGILSLIGTDIPYIDVNDIKSAREAVAYAIKHASEYDCIFFDSLSEIAEIILSDAMQKTPDPRKIYPETEQAVTRLVRQLRDNLPCSVVWLAKEDVSEDDLGRKTIRPSVPGSKFSARLGHLPDLVGRMVVDTVQKEDGTTVNRRTLRFVSDGTFVAKTRGITLPELCPANIGKIIGKVKESGK